MYEDSKLTYTVIAILIVALAVAAYFLQKDKLSDVTDTSNVKQEEIINATSTTFFTPKTNKVINTSKATVTATSGKIMNIPQNIKGAILKTSYGDIEFEFATTSPNTVANFVSLASTKFYDGVRFHRVMKDFMIQTGDPFSKDIFQRNIWGQGGPGYKFKDELTGKEKYTFGIVAMANSGPNTNGSQFFIVTANPDVRLDPNYTIFGHVIKGMDIASKIQEIKTTGYPNDQALEDVFIDSVVLK